jgi:hypothetical protein
MQRRCQPTAGRRLLIGCASDEQSAQTNGWPGASKRRRHCAPWGEHGLLEHESRSVLRHVHPPLRVVNAAAESAIMTASNITVGCWVGPMITRSTSFGISIPSSLSVGISAGMLRSWILQTGCGTARIVSMLFVSGRQRIERPRVLARAMNLLFARVNPLRVCPPENSGCGPISLQSRHGSECKKDCSR